MYLFLNFNFRHVSYLVLMFLLLPLNMEISSKGLICIKEYRKPYKFFISRANSFFYIRNWQNSGKRPLGNLGMGISVLASASESACEYNYSLLHSMIVIYLFIHGKCNPWDYVTMTRQVRLFKVWKAWFLHHKSIGFALARHNLSAIAKI